MYRIIKKEGLLFRISLFFRPLMAEQPYFVKFGGEMDGIDANILLTSMLGITSVIQLVNEKEFQNEPIKIRIDSTQKGSFEVFLGLVSVPVSSYLFSGNPLERLRGLAEVVTDVFKLQKLLGGEKPTSVTKNEDGKVEVKTTVIGSNNTVNNTIVVSERALHSYDAPNVRKAVQNSTKLIVDDPEITGLEMGTPDRSVLFEATREDLPKLSASVVEDTEATQTIIIPHIWFEVIKPDLTGSYNWDFRYQGKKFSAPVTDAEYIEKVTERQVQFVAGDRLEVDAEAKQEYNATNDTYQTKSYKVTKVHRKQSAQATESLFPTQASLPSSSEPLRLS
jgi:hypothetical protein